MIPNTPTTHTHTQCSEDSNSARTVDCPRPLASLTNTYGGSVSTLGLCTTCTRWLVASTNKISTPYNKQQQCWSLYLPSSSQLRRASHSLYRPSHCRLADVSSVAWALATWTQLSHLLVHPTPSTHPPPKPLLSQFPCSAVGLPKACSGCSAFWQLS